MAAQEGRKVGSGCGTELGPAADGRTVDRL